MSYAWLPVMSMLLFLSFVLLPRTGQTGPVGIRGWGCSMGGIDEMIQRSGVAVVTVCLYAHGVGWRDDGLNVAVSQRGVGRDCILLHKL
jgi:hypothetical protein